MMTLTKSFLFASMILLLSPLARSEDHPLTKILGDEIDLYAADHSIAGKIKDFVIFGDKPEGKMESTLIMKKDGQRIEVLFSKTPDGMGGVISHIDSKTQKLITTKITFVSVDQSRQTITLDINGVKAFVEITAKSFANGHFQDPTYTITLPFKKLSFHFVEGNACYGYSVNLLMQILGAYFHGESLNF